MKKTFIKWISASVAVASILSIVMNRTMSGMETMNVMAAESYVLYNSVPVYGNASDAASGTNSIKTYGAGTYYVYKTFEGMINISKTDDTAGGWIDPSDNTAPSVPSETTSTTAPEQSSETGKYTVYSPVPVYISADSARNRTNSTGTYAAGTYFIYKTYNGMINISRTEGTPGAWINPGSSTPAPSTTTPKTTAPKTSTPGTKPVTTTPGTSAPAPQNPVVGQTYVLNSVTDKYITADGAKSRTGSIGKYSAGTYYVYKIYNGMINISSSKGNPGAWINPGTVGTTPSPTTTTPATSNTRPGTSTATPTSTTGDKISGNTYILSSDRPKYSNAQDAATGKNSVGTILKGTYYIYKQTAEAINITKTPGVPGAWISLASGIGSEGNVPGTPGDILKVINVDSMYQITKEISQNYGSRYVGSANNQKAAEYIKNKLASYGYNAKFQTYQANPLSGMDGKSAIVDWSRTVSASNIIATLPDYDPNKKNVIISAHFDTVIGTPGANDNASGVAMALEFANYLKGQKLNYNPVIVILNGEEVTKSGAKHYVNTMDSKFKQTIESVITMDMVGYGNNYELWNTSTTNKNKYYNQTAISKAKELGLNLISYAEDKSWGDYYTFEHAGLPTVTFMMEDWTYWHGPSDNINLIEKNHFSNISKLVKSVLDAVQKNLQ